MFLALQQVRLCETVLMSAIISKLLVDRHRPYVGGIMTDWLDPASKSFIHLVIASLVAVLSIIQQRLIPLQMQVFRQLQRLQTGTSDWII